ncbi:hypothetical protein LX64_00882 [Chitinophaga skermanii]|uniref:Immunity protein Imm33 domain-containing protein n=1 Tax=Chitinophaga skermanii TaxID=331697 RepID=A0A327QWB3_9BACT|nr:DUF2185 domain-containing protein [Chitinophaga skermanii]RAJ08235.1 hypothetical protein LX64_00882 [Chitinophaga skermanii]
MHPSNKKFKLTAAEIVPLVPNRGGCIATDMITVEGLPIMYMYRDEPVNEVDTGWQFFAGIEPDEYVNDHNNAGVYDVNTIANYDPAIIPYLDLPIGTELEREEGTDKFNIIAG